MGVGGGVEFGQLNCKRNEQIIDMRGSVLNRQQLFLNEIEGEIL